MRVDRFGRLSCVVNNAGIAGAFGFITEIDGDGAAVTFPVLVKGAFYGIKHGVRAMRAHSGGGSVVNIASAAGTGGGYGPLPTRRPRRRW